MKTLLHFLAVGMFLGSAAAALADRTTVVKTSTVTIDRVAAARFDLPDGGQVWKGHVCGSAEKEDGGAAPLDAPCVTCESVTWNGLTAACVSAFRAANTD